MTVQTITIEVAPVFAPFLEPKRYKAAHGGRGSGKSRDRAAALVEHCLGVPGTRALCLRQVQRSLSESAKRLVEDEIARLKAPGFRPLHDRTETPGGGLIVYNGLQDHTADSLKSYEGFDIAWVEEAHTITQRSLDILRPTLRKPNSELWFTWNPRRKTDPVDAFFRGPNAPPDSVVVKSNWSDNPWFPDVLKAEREFDELHNPETYLHIWEGEYATIVRGAYYAEALVAAEREGRICKVTIDPMAEVRAWWDLGVGDATAIWIGQYVGREIRMVDYLEGEGQPLSYYLAELRELGWGKALCILPHDGAHRDSVQAARFDDHIRAGGFRAEVCPNQGAGAARLRIEAGRRLFPRIWFDRDKTAPGREALGSYHERRNDDRDIGLGPEHDWSSHASDAFGLACAAYGEPKPNITRRTFERRPSMEQAQAWMGS